MTDQQIKTNLNYYSDYFEALLWADVEESPDIKGEHDFTTIDKDSLVEQFKQLDQFFDKASHILDETDYTHAQACHDFYFTRCGHGVGFWENDHCNEEQGEKLTEIAKSFGTVDMYESGDTNTLYLG